MKKRKLIIGIVSCILLFGILSGCGGKAPKALSGRYIGQDKTRFSSLEFFSDGKYTSSHSNYEGNYSIDGNRIRLEGVLVDSVIYYFKASGNTLELSYDEDFKNPDIYKKQ